MKAFARTLVMVIIPLTALAITGCSDSVSPRPSDPLVQQIIAMGFNPREIVDRGDYFLVEGDIVIRKRDLMTSFVPESPSDLFPGPMFQARTNQLVSAVNVVGIRVSVSGQLSAGWQEATRQAIEEWTGITGARIEFVESGPAQVTVTSACCLGAGVIAQASFPSNGNPGPTIQVSTAFEHYTASGKLFIMAHEFGHTIGFRHTNWNASIPGCGSETAGPWGAILIGNTPATDAPSVMNKCSGGTEWSGFSFWDIEAARVLYNDSPTLTITVQQNNDRVLTWTSISGASSYRLLASYRRCWDDYEFGYTCDPDRDEWHEMSSLQYVDTKPCEYNQWGYPGEQSWVEYQVFPRFQGGDGALASDTVAETPDVQPCWWVF